MGIYFFRIFQGDTDFWKLLDLNLLRRSKVELCTPLVGSLNGFTPLWANLRNNLELSMQGGCPIADPNISCPLQEGYGIKEL